MLIVSRIIQDKVISYLHFFFMFFFLSLFGSYVTTSTGDNLGLIDPGSSLKFIFIIHQCTITCRLLSLYGFCILISVFTKYLV